MTSRPARASRFGGSRGSWKPTRRSGGISTSSVTGSHLRSRRSGGRTMPSTSSYAAKGRIDELMLELETLVEHVDDREDRGFALKAVIEAWRFIPPDADAWHAIWTLLAV